MSLEEGNYGKEGKRNGRESITILLVVENKGILNSSEIINQHQIDENISNTVQMINVFGEQIEPVCNYYRCHHKFSDHGYKSHSSCKRKHLQNSIVGIGGEKCKSY